MVEPVPHLDPRARAHARGRQGAPPASRSISLETVLEHAEGLVCLSGCALRGVHDEPTLKRLLEAFGPDRLRVELQRPFLHGDRARNRRLASSRGDSGCPASRPATCTPTPARALRCRTRWWRCALHTTLDASEPRATRATSATCSPRRPRWPRASPSIRMRWRRRRGWPSGCGSTCAATWATAIPGAEDAGRCASWRSCATRGCGSATGRAARAREAAPRRACRRSCGSSRSSGCPASSCCTTTCSSWPARSRSRCGGLTPPARCCRPGAAVARASPRSSAT